MSCICSSLDDEPLTTTVAVRGASQLRSTPMTLVCTPAARALARSLTGRTQRRPPQPQSAT
eukprot:11433283-Alexandrium_andersonii.AAC.1